MKNSIDINPPLSEQTYFILLSLRASPKHGYAIAKDVQSLSNGRIILSVSTLYTTLKRLLDDQWIKLIDTTAKDSNRPRKIYELTKIGGSVLLVEVQRLGTLVSAARAFGMEGVI
jgi:DNA-binding PadR family transcriptional regulator